MSKYWNKQGQYQAEFDAMSNELMPVSGAADSLAGELVRAVNRLYYDAFNNGFCNNTSGAINFLTQYLVPFYHQDRDLADALSVVEPKTNTGGYSTVGASTGLALDTLVDRVAALIIAQPQLRTVPAPCDLFDLEDPEYVEEEEDYEDEDDYRWESDEEIAHNGA
jgi:hypothetical protein